MKKRAVPLLKIDTDKSIYFDFSTQELFIQEFVGAYMEKQEKVILSLIRG